MLRLVILTGLCAMIALLAHVAMSDPTDLAPTVPEPTDFIGCRFPADARGAFEVHLEAEAEADGGAAVAGLVAGPGRSDATGTALRFDGRLDWMTIAPTGQGAASLVLALVDSDGIRLKMGLEVGPDCGVVRVGTEAESDDAAMALAHAVARTLDLRIADAETWSAQHRDTFGPWTASYRRDGGIIRRSGREMDEAAGGGPLVVTAPVSTATAHGGAGPWFERVHLMTRIEARAAAGGPPLLSATERARLDAVAPARGALGGVDGMAWLPLGEGRSVGAATAPSPPTSRPPSVTDGIAHLLERLEGDGAAHSDALSMLEAWIADADTRRSWVEALVAGVLDPRLQDLLVHALRRHGDAKTLLALLDARELDRAHKGRVLHALARLEAPPPEVADAIVRVAVAPDADPEDRAIALLSAGTLSRLAGERGEAATRAIVADAIRMTLAQDDPARALDALAAAGNSRDPELFQEVLAWTERAETGLRMGAAEALGKMPGPSTVDELVSLAAMDADVDVRVTAAHALARRAADGDAALTAPALRDLASALVAETDAEVRAGLIRLLGEASRRSPESLDALVAHFAREASAQNRALIGRYVEARRLAGAR